MAGHEPGEESSEMGRNMMVFIPVCLLLVKEESFTSAPLRILTLPSASTSPWGQLLLSVDPAKVVLDRRL